MTYVILSVVVLAALCLATLGTLRALPVRPLLLTAAALVMLTAVFDNVIVGLDIVAYDESKILGVLVPIAPIEDFAYALGAVVLVPALWTWLGTLSARRSPRRGEPAPASQGEPVSTSDAEGAP